MEHVQRHNPGPDGPNGNRLVTILAVLLAAGYFVFLYSRYQPAYSTMDAHEYHNQARLIATTGKTYFVPDGNDVQYIGFTWRLNGNDRYYPIAPPGFPLALAVPYRLLGPEPALLLNPLLAALCIILVFAISGSWWGAGWGLFAAALCTTFPAINIQALFGYSHMLSLFLLLLSIYLVNRWDESDGSLYAFLAGLALGAIPSVRTVEGIFIPAVGIYALLLKAPGRFRFREFLAFALGIAVPMGALMYYNHVSFGAVYETGYKLRSLDVDKCFSVDYFRSYAAGHLRRIFYQGAGPVFAVGAAAALLMFLNRADRKRAALIFLVTVPFCAIIMSNYTAPSTFLVRYFIPMFPLYAISCAWLLKTLAGNHRTAAVVMCSAVVLSSAWWGIPKSLERMDMLGTRNRVLAGVNDILDENAPKGSVVVASEPMCQFLEYMGRWRLASTSRTNLDRHSFDLCRGGPGWSRFMVETWKWAGDDRVFWIVGSGSEKCIESNSSDGIRWKKLGEIHVPDSLRNDDNARYALRQKEGAARDREKDGLEYDPGNMWLLERTFVRLFSNESIAVYELIPESRDILPR